MRFFGTDGIRDVWGEGRLAPGNVARIGRALGRFAGGDGARVVLGRDPRPSGVALSDRLGRALTEVGCRVVDLGVVPTPVVAWTLATEQDPPLALGIALSASHNPPAYNGIKPFAPGGRKLDEAEERAIEAGIDTAEDGEPRGPAPEVRDGATPYLSATAAWLGSAGALAGWRLVVDVAAGAAATTAPRLLQRLGAEVVLLHDAGSRDINDGCGTEHPEAWLEAVRAHRPDAGLAFDGDADRVLLADPEGGILDGDVALAVLAEDALVRDALPGRLVVGTVMTNLGLEHRLGEMGVRLDRVPVGDRHVAARMRETGAAFGAEPSGHVVLERDGARIGDGLVAGVRILEAAARLGRPLAALRRATPRYPQVLENVRVARRRPLDDWPSFQAARRAAEARLGPSGRLVVRYSGTEPLLRIMVEGRDEALVRDLAAGLRDATRGA